MISTWRSARICQSGAAGFYTATAVPVSLPANAASMRMSSYNDLRYISLLSIRFCRSEGNHTSDETHICPCSSYNPFAFILLIGCKDSHLMAISNLPVEISADFLLDIKYLQCHFSNFCWTVVKQMIYEIYYSKNTYLFNLISIGLFRADVKLIGGKITFDNGEPLNSQRA